MSFFLNIVIGLIIGIGFIIPGVSGGALAVILGVYDKIFCSIKNIKNKSNFFFLLSVGLGCIIGAIGFGNVILFLLNTREVPTKYIFIGLVIGGIPPLIKNIKAKSSAKFKITPFIVAVILSIILYVLEQNNIGINISQELLDGHIPILSLFIAGILYAVGKIVPGISGAALLILVGMYNYLLEIIANPLSININILISLIPFIIGALVGIFILYRLLNFLFDKYYMATYSAILGFVIGSLLYLFPGFSFNILGLVCIILLICSAFLSYLLTK